MHYASAFHCDKFPWDFALHHPYDRGVYGTQSESLGGVIFINFQK